MSDRGAMMLAKLLWGERYVALVPSEHDGRRYGYRVGRWTLASEEPDRIDEPSGEGVTWEDAFRDADVDGRLIAEYASRYPSQPQAPGDGNG